MPPLTAERATDCGLGVWGAAANRSFVRFVRARAVQVHGRRSVHSGSVLRACDLRVRELELCVQRQREGRGRLFN